MGSCILGCSDDVFIMSRLDVDCANELFVDGYYDWVFKVYDEFYLFYFKVVFNWGFVFFYLECFDDVIVVFGVVWESLDFVLKVSSYFHMGNV